MVLKKVFPLMLLLMVMLSGSVFADEGKVVYYNGLNRSVVVSSFLGYSCGFVKHFSSNDNRLNPGDIVEGSFGPGDQTLQDKSGNRTIKVNFDEFWVSKEKAQTWVKEHKDSEDSLW